MIDLSKIKEDFSVLVKDAQPWTLTQFVMWLDLKLSEFKIKGYMVLDHNVKTKPKWLVDEDKTSDVAPTPAPCRHCHKSDERQFYSDIHASPASLEHRTVTKGVTDASRQQDSDDANIRGEVGIIDLSHGMVPKKSNVNSVSGRGDNLQIHSYRQMSSHDFHRTDSNTSTGTDKRVRPDIIEIDAPSPPEKVFVSHSKLNPKTSTPTARFMQKPKSRPSLSIGTAIYTSTSSSTTPTFSSSSYVSPSSRSVPSNFANRKYALGAPPSSSASFSPPTNVSDYQNLENLIAQTVQYNESLCAQGQQPGTGGTFQNTQPQRQIQTSSSLDYGHTQTSFIQASTSQSSFVEPQTSQTSFSDSFSDQQSHMNVSSNDPNLFVPTSEAVPVALHANIDVINRDNSMGSAPSTSDITEIKIESDDNEDTSINESFMTDTSTAQTSLMDTGPGNTMNTSQPIQSQSQSYSVDPGGLPKPGLVDPETARAYQMVELVTGSGVYVYDKNIAQAFKVGTEKETGTYSGEKMARYLLNVFWSRKELVGATLSKAGRGKKILNQQIIEAILDFTENNGRHKRYRCRESLRSSISSRTCQENKRLMKHRNYYLAKLSTSGGDKQV